MDPPASVGGAPDATAGVANARDDTSPGQARLAPSAGPPSAVGLASPAAWSGVASTGGSTVASSPPSACAVASEGSPPPSAPGAGWHTGLASSLVAHDVLS